MKKIAWSTLAALTLSATAFAAATPTIATTTTTDTVTAPASWHGTPMGFVGDYTITNFVVSMDKEAVRKMLPPELELLPQIFTDALHHPVFVFNNQFAGLHGVGNFASASVDYSEYAIYIPFVQLKPGFKCGDIPLGPTAFMPKLYLNNQMPIDMGRKFYGYNKFLGDVDVTATSFSVKDHKTGEMVYSAEYGAEVPLNWLGREKFKMIMAALPESVIGKMDDGSIIWSGITFGKPTAVSLESIKVTTPMQIDETGINSTLSSVGAFRYRGQMGGSVPVACKR